MLTQSFVYKNESGQYYCGQIHGLKIEVTDNLQQAMRFSSFAELQSYVHQNEDFGLPFFMRCWEEITLVSGD